jgi:catechol 2,3-dioxygenase-like lactoylglutathione lyase family enzyme
MHLKATPMIHVPDIRAAVDWYQTIGFRLLRTHGDGDHLDWALLACGQSELMFNIRGQASDAHRREVDLYIQVDDIEEVRGRLTGKVDIVEDLHDTEYGMREFIVRDLNRFWISFGQSI